MSEKAMLEKTIQKKNNHSSRSTQVLEHNHSQSNSVLTSNRSESAVQLKVQYLASNYSPQIIQQKTTAKDNNTGLPSQLKQGIEHLSGYSMDDVKVHRNSNKPAQLQAHAYSQGNQIHLGPGQEKHLPHEAWHVVQQKQGRVKPTLQLKGKEKVFINDESHLEKEADHMGDKAAKGMYNPNAAVQMVSIHNRHWVLQRVTFAKEDASGLYGDRKYTREKDGKTEHLIEEMHSEKMQMLRLFANDLRAKLIDKYNATDNKADNVKAQIGPHIAVSRHGGVLYVALNTNFRGKQMVSTADLQNAAYEVAKEWVSMLPADIKSDESERDHAMRWLVTKGGADKKHVIDKAKIKAFGGKGDHDGAIHGEMRILHHIANPANNAIKVKPEWNLGQDKKKVIRIGGTLFDCLDCHEAEHGKMADKANPLSAKSSEKTSLFDKQPFDRTKEFVDKHFIVLSPGTHGNAFEGWTHHDTGRARANSDIGNRAGFFSSQQAMPNQAAAYKKSFDALKEVNGKLKARIDNGYVGRKVAKEKWNGDRPSASYNNALAIQSQLKEIATKLEAEIAEYIRFINSKEQAFGIAPSANNQAKETLYKQSKHWFEERKKVAATFAACKPTFDVLSKIVDEFNLPKNLVKFNTIINLAEQLTESKQKIQQQLQKQLEEVEANRKKSIELWNKILLSCKEHKIEVVKESLLTDEGLEQLKSKVNGIKIEPNEKEKLASLKQLLGIIEKAQNKLKDLLELKSRKQKISEAIKSVSE